MLRMHKLLQIIYNLSAIICQGNSRIFQGKSKEKPPSDGLLAPLLSVFHLAP